MNLIFMEMKWALYKNDESKFCENICSFLVDVIHSNTYNSYCERNDSTFFVDEAIMYYDFAVMYRFRMLT